MQTQILETKHVDDNGIIEDPSSRSNHNKSFGQNRSLHNLLNSSASQSRKLPSRAVQSMKNPPEPSQDDNFSERLHFVNQSFSRADISQKGSTKTAKTATVSTQGNLITGIIRYEKHSENSFNFQD